MMVFVATDDAYAHCIAHAHDVHVMAPNIQIAMPMMMSTAVGMLPMDDGTHAQARMMMSMAHMDAHAHRVCQ
jgi:hypothetical protein